MLPSRFPRHHANVPSSSTDSADSRTGFTRRCVQFAGIVLAFVFLPAAGLALVNLRSALQDERAQWNRILTTVADAQAAALAQMFEDGIGVTRTIARYPTAAYLASGSRSATTPFPADEGPVRHLSGLLSEAVDAYSLLGIWVVGPDRVLAQSAGAPDMGTAVMAAARRVMREDTLAITVPTGGTTAGILFAAPIQASPGQPAIGAAVMMADVGSRATGILRAGAPGATGEALLAAARADSVFLLSARREEGWVPPATPPAFRMPALAAALAAGTTPSFTTPIDVRGVPAYVVTRPLGVVPFSVVAKVDRAEVAGAARRRALGGALNVALLLAAVAGLGLAGWQASRVRLATSLAESEGQVRLLTRAVEQSPASIIMTDPGGAIVYVNPAFERVTGYSAAEVTGKNPRVLKSGVQGPEFYRQLWQTITAGHVWRGELVNRRKDGTLFRESALITPVTEPDGSIGHFLAVKEDVTEHRLLEDQFRQAQKMEAVGRLAGGVAHDFNNILTVIMGYTGAIAAEPGLAEHVRADLAEVQAAAKRAAGLTGQLLAFSRRQVIQPAHLSLNTVIRNLDKMVRRLIGETIRVETDLALDLPTVFADAGQLEQVILNLCVNARDAMPGGGVIRISTTATATADGRPTVLLELADTGVGMSPEVREHLFEPFFTTKGVGKGTGLGLATVYGIVQQAGGTIEVESEPGEGTTFRIFLPATSVRPAAATSAEDTALPRGTETILLAEDEHAVRSVLTRLLKERGYAVLAASDGHAALRLAAAHGRPIDLLITDVVMPGMSGPALAGEFQAAHPGARVLYISGYADAGNGQAVDPTMLLSKPFRPAEVATRVRQVLDATPTVASA